MNVFAKFDGIPLMILEVIKETKRYGHMLRTHGRFDDVKTVYPPTNTDYKRLKQVTNLIISLDIEVSTPIQLSNTPQNPITDLIGY